MFKGDSWGRKDVSWTPHFRVFLSIYLFWRRPRGRPTTCWITWGLFITSGLRTPWEPPRRSWRMWMGVKEVWTTPSGHRLVKCTKKKGYMNRSVSVLFCVLPSSGLKNVRCSLKSSKKKSQKETGPCCLMIPAQTTPFFEELLSITLSFRGSDALNQNAQALVWIQSSPVELSGGHRDRYLRCNAGPFSFATARSSHLLKEGAAPHW